jgi:hypothetical protein
VRRIELAAWALLWLVLVSSGAVLVWRWGWSSVTGSPATLEPASQGLRAKAEDSDVWSALPQPM